MEIVLPVEIPLSACLSTYLLFWRLDLDFFGTVKNMKPKISKDVIIRLSFIATIFGQLQGRMISKLKLAMVSGKRAKQVVAHLPF